MARRGSENRRKTHSVLVRLSEGEYCRLTERATREGASRAEYLRRRMNDSISHDETAGDDRGTGGLPETDRILLAGATRSMGHLAGLMKLGALKTPDLGSSSSSIRSVLEDHHRMLQNLQGQIRDILERTR